MAKHTAEGKARNKALYESYKRLEASVTKDTEEVRAIIAESLKGNGIDEAVMGKLASVFRGYEHINSYAESAWERYENHCTMYDYEIKY